MTSFESDVAELVWTQCWQIAAVAIIVGIVHRLFCGRRPHLGYVLWLLVLVKCLTPPLWTSPIGVFSWRSVATAIERDEMPPPPVMTHDEAPAVLYDDDGTFVATQPVDDEGVEAANTQAADVQTAELQHGAEQSAPSTDSAVSAITMLAIAWFVGVVLFFARVARATYVCRAAIRRSLAPVDQALAELALGLQRRLGIRRKVRIEVISQSIGPLTYGLIRPRIVLPATVVSRRSGDELMLVLAHELVHVRRGDSFVGLLQMAVQCVWWFHPCVWWANRRISIERERCCDEEVVLELGCPPARYAHCLIDVLQAKRQSPAVAFVVGIRSFEVTKQRLEYVMRHTGLGHKKTPWAYWILFAVAAGVIVPVAGRTEEPANGVQTVQAQDTKGSAEAKPAESSRQSQPSTAKEKGSPPAAANIDVSNVELMKGDKAGTAILTFDVDAPKGTRFFVAYMHHAVRGAYGQNAVWEIVGDQGANVRVELSYSLDFKGDRRQNPLMTQERMLSYRMEAEGVGQPGFTTNVSAPLLTVAADDRVMRVVKTSDDRDATTQKGQRRVLVVVPKSEAEKPIAETSKRTELVVGLYTDGEKKERSEAEQLAAHWGRQAHEIGSAHIECRMSRFGEDRLAPLNPEQVNAILENAQLNDNAENFEAVLTKLLAPDAARERLWSPVEFYAIGLKTREDLPRGIHVFDGELDLDYDEANNQISVYRAGESRLGRMHITDFRVRTSASGLERFEQELLPNNRIALRVAGDKIVADWMTGFVYESIVRSRGRATDTYQFAPMRYPGGIVFPKLKIELTYRSDELDGLELIYIDKAEFNEGMMADAFKLAAKTGTKVFMFKRDPVARPESFAIREDTKDVAELVRERLER
ncbi:MAG: M56 family metallopeptidase [Pirellulales bacterium]